MGKTQQINEKDLYNQAAARTPTVFVMSRIDREFISPVSAPHRIAMHGQCNNRKPHDGHLFVDAEIQWDMAGNLLFWDCPGQYVDCRNCDDRYCMDCVLRIVHDQCTFDCPDCCYGK